MRLGLTLLSLVLLGTAVSCADDAKPIIREGDSKLPLKQRHQFNGIGATGYEGVVTDITKDTMTVRWIEFRTGEEKERTLHPLDLHRAGEVQDWANGPNSYRWQDVKKGDKVFVDVQEDTDKTPYVLDIMITRRPGEKLPKSQKPDNDRRWKFHTFLNDIDNGEDKTEKEIYELYPPRVDEKTGKTEPSDSLPPAYRVKVMANRARLEAEKAKKEKDLKAAPPDKKK